VGCFAGSAAKGFHLKYVMINSELNKKKNANSIQCFVYEINFSQFMLTGNNIYLYIILYYRHNELGCHLPKLSEYIHVNG
jgi:hypothetical protein